MERGRTERKQRRVTLRPAPDTMSFLTGHLPVEQGVACLAALKLHTDALKAVGDARTRGQIMADTLVERITGQATADRRQRRGADRPPGRAADRPGEQPHGDRPRLRTHPRTAGDSDHRRQPGPEDVAEGLDPPVVRLAGVAEPEPPSLMEAQIIDLFSEPRRPAAGNVVGIGKRIRRFTGKLAELVRLRDQTCRMPYCDAQIRHLDHIVEYRHGGQTTLSQWPGTLRTAQLPAQHAGLAYRSHPRRTRRPGPRDHDHHTDRPPIPEPSARPAVISRGWRDRRASLPTR